MLVFYVPMAATVVSFNILFHRKEHLLLQKLEVTENFLSMLAREAVITQTHIEKIKNDSSNRRKVGRLLKILQLRDDSLVPQFCQILIDDGQRHVVKLLLPEGHTMRLKFFPEEVGAEVQTRKRQFEEAFHGRTSVKV